MYRIFSAVLALSTAFGTSVVLTLSTEKTHAAGHTLQDRVAERRARRWAELPNATIKTIDDRTLERINRRRLQDDAPSVQEAENNALSILKRREERRNRRLAGQPVPVKQQVIDGVNIERAKQGIPPLTYQGKLETSAQAHADDMLARAYFSHENPEGERSVHRIKRTGYGVVDTNACNCSYRVALGENIAKGQQSVEQVIREWMASPTHREAMLSKDYKEIGVGVTEDIWVLNFGAVEIDKR